MSNSGATRFHLIKSVKRHWVVNENLFSRLLLRREQRKKIEQVAVIGRVAGSKIVRVRPVGAPDHAVRRRGDDCPGEGRHFDEGESKIGMHRRFADLIGAAHFHPDMAEFHELQQQLKPRLIEPFCRFNPRDMVNNHRHRHSAYALFMLDKVLHVDMHVYGPAQFGDVFHASIEDIGFDVAARPVEQIEADAADAAVVEPAQVVFGRFVVHARDAAKPAGGMFHRVEGRRVVQAVDAGLDHHGALDAQHGDYFQIMFERRGRRRVLTCCNKRESLRRTEDVEMGVASAGRRCYGRLSSVGVGRIAVRHFILVQRSSFEVPDWAQAAHKRLEPVEH